MARIIVPPAKPYFPNSDNDMRITRRVNETYYQERLQAGCPHCDSVLVTKRNHRTGGYFAHCTNEGCDFLDVDGRNYYVSSTCESIPLSNLPLEQLLHES
jgi:hypothetical protein